MAWPPGFCAIHLPHLSRAGGIPAPFTRGFVRCAPFIAIPLERPLEVPHIVLPLSMHFVIMLGRKAWVAAAAVQGASKGRLRVLLCQNQFILAGDP